MLIARRVLHEGRVGIGLALLLAAYVPLSLAAAEVGGGLVAVALWAAIAAGAAASKDEPSTVSRPLPAR